MDYGAFLALRRERIARLIERAYATLRDAETTADVALSLQDLIGSGESVQIEFKSSLRLNRHTRQHDARMEFAVLKTIAAFLNTHGGTLVIGVMDDGQPVGIEDDGFENEDRMALHLVSLLKAKLGPQTLMYIHPRFEDHDACRVMVVECARAGSPVFVRDANVETFYVRAGPSSAVLLPSEMQAYIRQRFG